MNELMLIAWDTSVFLAWLQGEKSAPLDAIKDRIAEVELGQIRLGASIVLFAELLDVDAPPDQLLRFEQMIADELVLLFDVDRRIARTAGRIRSQAGNLKPKKSVKTPDALHLACAIHTDAIEFHTLDRQLLNLSGTPIVDGLTIRLPG